MDKHQKIRLKKVSLIVLVVGIVGLVASLSALLIYQNNLFVTADKISSQTEIYNNLDVADQPNLYVEFSAKALSTAPEEELVNFNQFAKMLLLSNTAKQILISEDNLDIVLGDTSLESDSDALSGLLSEGAVNNKDLYNTFGDRFAITKITQSGGTYLLANISDNANWENIKGKLTAEYKVYDNVNIVAFSVNQSSDFSELKFSPNANTKATETNTESIKYIQDKGRYGEIVGNEGKNGYITGTVVGVVYFNLDTVKYGEGAFGPSSADDLSGMLVGVISITPSRGTTMTLSLSDVAISGDSYPPKVYTEDITGAGQEAVGQSVTTIPDTFYNISSPRYNYSFVLKDGANLFNQYASTSLFNRIFGTENIINSLGMDIENPDVKSALGPDIIGFSSGSYTYPDEYTIYASNPNPSMLAKYSELLYNQKGYVKDSSVSTPGVTRYRPYRPEPSQAPAPQEGVTEPSATPGPSSEPAGEVSPSSEPTVTEAPRENNPAMTGPPPLDPAEVDTLLNAVEPITENCDIVGVIDTSYFLFRYFFQNSPGAVAVSENNVLGHIGICQRDDVLSITLINQ